MRGVFQSGPEFLAVIPSFNARCLSVRTKIPGDISSWNARCVPVRTKSPGGFYLFKCEAFVGPSQYAWRYLPILMRGVRRPEPKFPKVFPNLNARRLSVRTEIPGGIYQCECEAFFGQNQNSPSEGKNVPPKEEFYHYCDGFSPPITRFRDGFRPVLGQNPPVALPFCFRPSFGLFFVFWLFSVFLSLFSTPQKCPMWISAKVSKFYYCGGFFRHSILFRVSPRFLAKIYPSRRPFFPAFVCLIFRFFGYFIWLFSVFSFSS